MTALTKTHPDDLIGDVIKHRWVSMIRECEDHQINLEAVQEAINWARRLMNAENSETDQAVEGHAGPPDYRD